MIYDLCFMIGRFGEASIIDLKFGVLGGARGRHLLFCFQLSYMNFMS